MPASDWLFVLTLHKIANRQTVHRGDVHCQCQHNDQLIKFVNFLNKMIQYSKSDFPFRYYFTKLSFTVMLFLSHSLY